MTPKKALAAITALLLAAGALILWGTDALWQALKSGVLGQ